MICEYYFVTDFDYNTKENTNNNIAIGHYMGDVNNCSEKANIVNVRNLTDHMDLKWLNQKQRNRNIKEINKNEKLTKKEFENDNNFMKLNENGAFIKRITIIGLTKGNIKNTGISRNWSPICNKK